MNRLSIVQALAILALGSSALPAAADSYNPSGYIVPGLTTMIADSDWNTDGRRGEGALKFGLPLSQSFDLQLGGGSARSVEADREYRQNLIGADILWLFSRGSFRPFLLAGLGGERDALSQASGSVGKNAPYVNAGLGLQAFVNESVFVQADARYVYGFISDDTWGRSGNGNVLFNLGLGFVFSVPPKATPVAAPVAAAAPAPMPAPAPAPTPAPAPAFEKVTLSASELFAFNKAELNPEQPRLDEIAEALNRRSEIGQIEVDGYTDRLGSDKYNLALSQKRADAVKAYLVSKGVAAERVVAVGKGKADPLVPCDGIRKRAALIECLAPNRRVEIAPFSFNRQVK